MSTRDLRDPSLDEVLKTISSLTPRLVETRSGVCASTVRAWRSGKTRSPQNKTMEFALRAAGFKRVIVPIDRR